MTNGTQTQSNAHRTRYPRGEHRHDIEPEKCSDVNGQFSDEFTAENVFQRSIPIPLQLQWVEAKREHPTSLIFMKVHRFYEVFHKDADVVVEELSNCIYMYGRTAHTGFPESCLERFTDELSEKGYDIIVI